MACPAGLDKALPDGLVRFAVVVPQNWLDCLSGSFEMVVGNGQKDVVGNVGTDVVMNGVDEPVIAIDGGQCPLEEIPIFATVPRNIVFGVV